MTATAAAICNRIFRETANWENAKKFCESIGGHLAVANSIEEHEFMKALHLLSFNKGRTWIGFRRDKTAKTGWRWVDGSTQMFNVWHQGEPNNEAGRENYGNLESDGLWNDNELNAWQEKLGVMCESENCGDGLQAN
ncbi:hypothetical protein RB195_008384 [Necator americanus]|uniref:C-type lectin domain-containing protein n=1 Tax=Necator americanus TaxID=51031 RepID=A0ABR1CR08_NECAM